MAPGYGAKGGSFNDLPQNFTVSAGSPHLGASELRVVAEPKKSACHVSQHDMVKLKTDRLSDLLNRVAIPRHSNRFLRRESSDWDFWRSSQCRKEG